MTRMSAQRIRLLLSRTNVDGISPKLAPETAMQLMGMGATVTRVLELKDRMTGKSPRKN